ncbi:MAG: hydrogenase expression/formation protein [Methanohalophilus sp. T328-1]|nr:MAG: hydrogenase expression/formation protein [Methanohalophilus sp. T328-1]
MDIEGYARHALLRGEEGIAEKLAERIMEIKDTDRQHAIALAKAAVEEARATLDVKGDVLTPITSGVTMGQFGVGSRGTGDFYAHEKIAEVIGSTKAAVDSTHLDDSGAVQMEGGDFLIVTIDGIHIK